MTRSVPAVLLLAATLGCLRPEPGPPVVYHLLQPIQPQGPAPARSGLAVEVLPVRVPDLLQRPQMVLSQGPGAVQLSETHRWANPLDQDMQRVLVQNLSLLLGSDAVVASPLGRLAGAAYRVQVEVRACAAQPGGLTLDAVWMVTRPGAAQALLLRRTRLTEALPGPGPDALAEAHSRLLAALSREIAEALLRRP